MNNEFGFLDILTIISFAIAIQNLKENQEQNDKLDKHLKNQDGILEEQTQLYLKAINDKLDRLLERS